jgi:hypothetical protein
MSIWKKGNWILFPFVITLYNVNMATTQGFVVDNSPLGVEAANKAGLECNITLNKTPLDIHNDFNGVTPSDPGKCYLKR